MGDRPRIWRCFLPRLSVRVLMMIILTLALGMGLLIGRARTQRQAIAAIEAAGGKVQYGKKSVAPGWLLKAFGDDFFYNIVWVDCRGVKQVDAPLMDQINRLDRVETLNFSGATTLTDAMLLRVANLKRLIQIDLSRTSVKGPGVAVVANMPDLKMLSLNAVALSDADLGHVGKLKELTFLQLDSRNLTDVGFRSLEGLTKLKSLTVTGEAMTSKELEHLRDMKLLETLFLIQTKVSTLEPIRGLTRIKELMVNRGLVDSAGLAPVADWKGLQSLSVGGCPIDDQGVDALIGLTNLERLTLQSTKVTDAGLLKLTPIMPGLTNLTLSRTSITDAGLAALEGGGRLQYVNLNSTRITDAGLAHLYGLTACKALQLSGTAVTQAGIDTLKAKLPKATISGTVPAVARPKPR